VEPYAIAAAVYAVAPHTGRSGWTSYNGSAGWMYRLIVESILGVSRKSDRLGALQNNACHASAHVNGHSALPIPVGSIALLSAAREVASGPIRKGFARPSRDKSRIQNHPRSNSHHFTDSLAELG
jgi:hypothetical protein